MSGWDASTLLLLFSLGCVALTLAIVVALGWVALTLLAVVALGWVACPCHVVLGCTHPPRHRVGLESTCPPLPPRVGLHHIHLRVIIRLDALSPLSQSWEHSLSLWSSSIIVVIVQGRVVVVVEAVVISEGG